MKSCPDPDVLLTVAATVAWDEDELRHLVACETCRDTRATLRAARGALIAEHAVPAGFADAVLRSLPSPSEGRVRSRLVGALLLSPVVGLTAFFALLASSGPMPVPVGPALAAAGAVALATAVRELLPGPQTTP
jgi:hypothetical protein